MQPFQENHTAVVYEDAGNMKLLSLDTGRKLLQNRKGNFFMHDTLDVPTGGKVYNNKSTGSIILLRPTQTLVTDTVPHKT